MASSPTIWSLPNCGVHERKHKSVKRFGTDIKNDIVYNQSVLSEVVSQQFEGHRDIGLFNISPGLVKPSLAKPALANFVLGMLELPRDTVSACKCICATPVLWKVQQV